MWYVFGAFGLVALMGGITLVWRGLASTGWPTAEGVVLSAAVEHRVATGESTSGGSTTFVPKVVYQYDLRGRQYESPQISYKQLFGTSDHCHKIIAKYPVGSHVKVYCHPTKPHESLLEPGVNFMSFIPLILGVIMTVFSVLGITGILK